MAAVAAQVYEEVLVEDVYGALLEVGFGGAAVDAAVLVAYLLRARVRLPVGRHYAVAVECVVAGVVGVEVAAEDEDPGGLVGVRAGAGAVFLVNLALGGVVRPAESLVLEVPDAAALVVGVLADEVPVLLEAAEGVAHGVCVLALDEGHGGIVGAILLAGLVAGVHGAEDVRAAVHAGALVLHGAGGVEGLGPGVGVLEVGTVAGLVAEAPDDDAGVVEVALDHALHAYHVGVLVELVLCQGGVPVAHAVRLDVGLVYHVQAVAVAEFVPERVVGVVAGAYGVDVELLHHADVAEHLVRGHVVGAVGAHFVAVHALDEDGLAVYQQLGVLYFNAAETDIERHGLYLLAAGDRGDAEAVEFGRFGAPEFRLVDGADPGGAVVLDLDGLREGLAGRGLERVAYLVGAGFGLNLEVIDAVHVRAHANVLHAAPGWTQVQPHAAGYAAEAPEVLALQVGAVAPAHDLERYHVVAALHVLGDVEGRFQLAVLAVAHFAAVHPHAYVGGGAADAQDYLALELVLGELEVTAVLAYVVMLGGHEGRVVLEVSIPGVAVVDVEGVAVAVELPDAGDGDAGPVLVVEAHGLEAGGGIDGLVEVFVPAEFPVAVEVNGGDVRTHAGAHGEAVHLGDEGVLPFGGGGSRGAYEGADDQYWS